VIIGGHGISFMRIEELYQELCIMRIEELCIIRIIMRIKELNTRIMSGIRTTRI
jgi:hypothetical protein